MDDDAPATMTPDRLRACQPQAIELKTIIDDRGVRFEEQMRETQATVFDTAPKNKLGRKFSIALVIALVIIVMVVAFIISVRR